MTEPTAETDPEPVLVTVVLTCHTAGCENAGLPLTLEVPEDVEGAICGPCGQPITDITRDQPDQPEQVQS